MSRTGRKRLAAALLTLSVSGCAVSGNPFQQSAAPVAGGDRAGQVPSGEDSTGELSVPAPPPVAESQPPVAETQVHLRVDFQEAAPADSSGEPPEFSPLVIASLDEPAAATNRPVGDADSVGKTARHSDQEPQPGELSDYVAEFAELEKRPAREPAAASLGDATVPRRGSGSESPATMSPSSSNWELPHSSSESPAIAALDPLRMTADEVLPPPSGAMSVREAGRSALTLEELQAMAMADHPAVSSAQARIAALQGRWVQAGLPPNPTATYNGNEIGADDVAGLHNIQIGQTYVTAGKLQLQQNVVAAQIEQARANLQAARARVRTDVRTAFVTALVAQRRLQLVQRLQEIAEESVRTVETMVAAQEVSRIELLQAQTEAQQAALSVENARAELAGARRRLAAVAARDSLADAPLKGDLGERLSDLQYAALEAETLIASPEVASRSAAIEQAQRALRLACARATPNINAQAGAGFDSGSDDTFAALQLSVPLPIRDRNQGNIRAARAEIRRAESELRRARRSISQRLADAFQSYRIARQRRERFESEIIPRAEETLDLSVQAFQAGEANYQRLLLVQRTLFQARLDQLDATAQAARAAALIDGFLLEGSLTSETAADGA